MNELTPEPVASTPLSYKDRSTGLILFGILTVFLGCLAGLLILVVIFGQAAAKTTHAPANFATLLPVIAIYGTTAVALVWLGIGSTLARRWARALLLIFSWTWLFTGIFVVVVMGFVMPKIIAGIPAGGTTGQPALPPAARGVIMVVLFLVFGVLFLLMPAMWTYFYNSRHVKATCEAHDPVTRWTDACPLPVLGFCLWLMVSVPMMLLMPMAGHGVMLFFGSFVTGLPGSLLWLVFSVLWSYAAWLLYHLDVRGWWLILIAMIVFMASSLMTFAQHDMIEMYRLMGYPDVQIEQIKQSGLLVGNRMSWLMSLSILPFLGYLLFIKKYLRRKP